MQTDKGFVIWVENWSFCNYASNWIWPVKHNQRDASFFAGAHAEIQRPDKRVKARPDILKIDKQNIQILQHFCCRLAMFAVETVNRNVKPQVIVTLPFHHVILSLTKKSMLRAKKRSESEKIAVVLLQNSRRMLKLCRDRCGMKQSADARAAKSLRPKFS